MKFAELIFAQSGGLFEARRRGSVRGVANDCAELSLDPRNDNCLPRWSGPTTAVALRDPDQPKVYASTLGRRYHRGWDSLRDEDRGQLLEHFVLGEIAARFGVSRLHYWRDKQQHEVDFVLEVARRRDVVAIECKSAAQKLDPAA